MTALVVQANSRTLPLPDNSVDLVVTSPPYFALRSYTDGGKHYVGQVGDEPTPQEFLDSLLIVTAECVRVLKLTGSLWVNLGDKYASYEGNRGAGQMQDNTPRGIKPKGAGLTGGGYVRAKSLMGLPWRYALRCIDDLGLILRAEIIWSKPNGLPESVTDRVRRSHEQWFHFTLEPRYFSAVDEVREPHTAALTTSRADRGGAGKHSRTDATRTDQDGIERTWSSNSLGKLPGSVWTIPTQPLKVPAHLGVDHFAAYPMEWPRRIIKGWSPAGICVDCDAGLRPVTVKEGGRPVARAHRHLPGYTDPAGEGMRDQAYSVTGYACDCEDKTWTASELTRLSTASARTDASSTANPATPSCAAAAGSTRSCTPAATATRPPSRQLRPAVVLDPFGGTGTTALVADALGRTGISVDLSHDYSRLARWRTRDPGQCAAALQVDKPAEPIPGQTDLFGEDVA